MAILFGCGGGGGGNLTQQTGIVTQPTKAVVKLATSGALPTGKLIGGIEATLTYAAGKGLSIGGSDAVASGVGSGSLLAANTNTAGQVRLGLISTGIQTGEFATATFTIAAGNSPVAGDFAIASGANVIDTDSVAQPGITVGIQSVTFQ
ncbi:MAG: hypothetical protein HYV06_03290 [Deltaproteobacteria bacterium]|nr:hypothetical protein [Deltaproteobacteria bacterium]